jgi:7-keto-8-aminopelargonate synthetase-like enzyme
MKNVLELINEIVTNGKNRGVGQFTTEDEFYDGRIITVEGNKLINFGSCSYLGLELDERLKDGAIEAIKKYGVQFSCSRTYMSCTLYRELESLVRKIFDAPVVLSTSVSLGHHAVIPVVVGENDAIIMDQQVHASVQDAAIKMKEKK